MIWKLEEERWAAEVQRREAEVHGKEGYMKRGYRWKWRDADGVEREWRDAAGCGEGVERCRCGEGVERCRKVWGWSGEMQKGVGREWRDAERCGEGVEMWGGDAGGSREMQGGVERTKSLPNAVCFHNLLLYSFKSSNIMCQV